jgi:hypothetical protein
VKLADFGIARAMNEVSTTNPDVVRGKLRYLAPEQVLGEPLGPAIDVWALGVSLYEALALRRPFPEDNEGQTVHAIVNGDFPALASLRPDLPAELVTIVARCLRREPGSRYPDCQDLALDLERLASAGASSITARVIGNWVERLAPADELIPLAPEEPQFTPQTNPALVVEKRDEPLQPVSTGREVTLEEGPALELFTPPAEQPVAPPTQAPRARWPLVVGVLVVLGLGAGSVAWRTVSRGGAQRQVLVTSTPSGATVKYGDRVLGTTPWAGDLPSGHEVELEVSAPGFQPVKRTLAAESLAPLNVTLKRGR